MKDSIGNELAIGDKVVFLAPHYRTLKSGHVKGFTTKMVVIEYMYERLYPNREWVPEIIHRLPEIVAKVS